MSRKHIDTNATPPAPTVIRVILTGELALRLAGKKPKVQLARLSNGRFSVTYAAHGTVHGRTFDNFPAAEAFFQLVVGERQPRARMVA